MNPRRFSEAGVDQFRAYLAALRQTPTTPPPPELVDDPRFTDVEPRIRLEKRQFATKFEAGEYLRDKLSSLPNSQLRIDVGLWSWLALWFFDELCPADAQNRRKPLDNAKYIANVGDHRFGLDKHLLFFPWKMCMLHGSIARCFLADPLGKDTRAQREWTGYHLNVSSPVVGLAARLYGNPTTGSLVRGATGKKPGNFRRFVQVLKQLEVTYDIRGMSTDEIQAALPQREFGGWIGT